MRVTLRPLPVTEVPVWEARYTSSEYALSAGTVGPLRITVADVTLSFDQERGLVGVDAYTNWERWERKELLPVSGVPARLLSLAEFDENGVGLGSWPHVALAFDERARRLALTFGDGVTSAAYAPSSSCVCEVTDGGELLRLTLSGLLVR